MTAVEQLTIKHALETLDVSGGGMPAKALMDQVERMIHRQLTTHERSKALAILISKEWAYTYRNCLTDEVTYAVTDQGRTAMFGL